MGRFRLGVAALLLLLLPLLGSVGSVETYTGHITGTFVGEGAPHKAFLVKANENGLVLTYPLNMPAWARENRSARYEVQISVQGVSSGLGGWGLAICTTGGLPLDLVKVTATGTFTFYSSSLQDYFSYGGKACYIRLIPLSYPSPPFTQPPFVTVYTDGADVPATRPRMIVTLENDGCN